LLSLDSCGDVVVIDNQIIGEFELLLCGFLEPSFGMLGLLNCFIWVFFPNCYQTVAESVVVLCGHCVGYIEQIIWKLGLLNWFLS